MPFHEQHQRMARAMAEYVAVMTAAALREGFVGPLFIQGDHVQVNAKKYAADADAELKALRALIEEELHDRAQGPVFQRQDRYRPWPNRQIDRQHFQREAFSVEAGN